MKKPALAIVEFGFYREKEGIAEREREREGSERPGSRSAPPPSPVLQRWDAAAAITERCASNGHHQHVDPPLSFTHHSINQRQK